MFKQLFLVSAVSLSALVGCGGGGADANNPPPLKVKNPKAVDVPQMTRNLGNRDMKSRTLSAFLLGEAGERAVDALPALEKLAAGPEGPDQKAAAAAIEKIKNPKPADEDS